MRRRSSENILANVKQVLETAKPIVNIAGIPALGAILDISILILVRYEAVKASDEDSEDIAVYVKALHGALVKPVRDAKDRGDFPLTPDLERRIMDLGKSLEAAGDSLRKYEGMKLFKRWWKQDEISRTLRAVNRRVNQALSTFQLEGQITSEQLLHSIDDSRILDTQLGPTPRSNLPNTQVCLRGTRKTLFTSIEGSLLEQGRLIVFLLGSPGTGKTAVARSVVEEMRKRGYRVASHFFDQSALEPRSLEAFVASIARQLADLDSGVRHSLVRQLKGDVDVSLDNAESLLSSILLVPLNGASSFMNPGAPNALACTTCPSSPQNPRFFIILDAANECGGPWQQQRLMDMLTKFVDLKHRVVFFVTSRPEPDISSAIKNGLGSSLGSVPSPLNMDELDVDETARDICAFVAHTIRDRFPNSPQPSHSEITQFAESCDWLFEAVAIRLQEVASLMPHLVTKPFPAAEALREVGSPLASKYRSPLDRIYADLIERTFASIGERHRPGVLGNYRKVIGALATLERPFTVAALAVIILRPIEDVRDALSPLQSVIDIPDDDNETPIRFRHTSFPEFLLSTGDNYARDSALSSQFRIAPAESHADIARQCLIMMIESLDGDNSNSYTMYDADDGSANPANAKSQMSKERQYAFLCWANHLGIAPGRGLDSLVTIWCKEGLLYNIYVLSSLGELQQAIPLLDKAQEWVRKYMNTNELAILLQDAKRFVQTFYVAIKESPRSLYTSAVPLMPSCHFRTQYQKLVNGKVSLLQGRPPTWPIGIWAQTFAQAVRAVAYAPDGLHLALGLCDGSIRVLSAITGKQEQILTGHEGAIQSVTFSLNGELIGSGSSDRTARIWSASTGVEKRRLAGHLGSVNAIAFSADGAFVASGSDDKLVRIWIADQSSKVPQVLLGHTDSISSVVFSPNGLWIASGSRDGSVRVWSTTVSLRQTPLIIISHSSPVNSVAFSTNGSLLAAGSNDCSVRILDARTGAERHCLAGHSGRVHSVGFSRDDNSEFVVSGSEDRTVRVWRTRTGEQRRCIDGHSQAIYSVVFSPRGEVASASDDRSVRVWSSAVVDDCGLSAGGEGHPNEPHVGLANSLPLSSGPDLEQIVPRWSRIDEKQKGGPRRHRGPVTKLAFSRDEKSIRSCDQSGETIIWKVADVAPEGSGDEDQIFDCDAEMRSMPDEGCWLSLANERIWAPEYLRGSYWSRGNLMVMDSSEDPGRLAILRVG